MSERGGVGGPDPGEARRGGRAAEEKHRRGGAGPGIDAEGEWAGSFRGRGRGGARAGSPEGRDRPGVGPGRGAAERGRGLCEDVAGLGGYDLGGARLRQGGAL